MLATVRRRVVRLARRHGINVEGDGIVDGDRRHELADESPLLAGLAAASASVAGRSAIGAGFDLHAGVAVPAGDRARLQHVCRYVLRPPIAQDALSIAPDGRVCLAQRRPGRDGTRALLLGPLRAGVHRNGA